MCKRISFVLFLMFSMIVFSLVMGLLLSPVSAQEMNSGNTLTTILYQLQEPIMTLVGLAVSGIVAWASMWLRTKWQLDVDARHREALQSALENAAKAAINAAIERLGSQSFKTMTLAPNMITTSDVYTGVDYVRRSVPDAVHNFSLQDPDIMRLIEPKILTTVAELQSVTGK